MKKLFHHWWREFRRWIREPRIIWRADNELVQITIEVQHWVPFFAFTVVFLWYIVDPTAVALMSAVMLGGVLLAAFLLSRAIARGVEGQRRLRFAAMQVGDELEEQIFLKNKTLLPVIWAEYLDRSNIPGYTVSSARAADADTQIDWRAHTVCTRRGVFALGPWELRIGEPFGILMVRQLYLQKQDILVYPPLAVLPEQFLPHRGALGDHRPLNQPLRAETIASTTVRSYVPGDPLRHIHWRTSARRGDPFVKVFAPEAASNVWLVPDFDSADHVGEGDDNSQEVMVTVVASLALTLLQQNLSVGIFASAENETVVLPRQGQTHLWTILQALAPLHAAPGRTLEDGLQRARGLVAGNDLLILVTPSLRPDWLAALRRISRSRGSTGRAEVVLLDPASFGADVPPNAAESFLALLAEQGITANILRRDDVHLVSGYYGEVSRWEFSVTGTGRAVARRAPRTANPLAEPASPPRWKTVE
ncbi:MAG: DUF58 domain-containing protein [Chloroflexi bacterium]|nr:MAG: DUF58 domain-containing protein [Chloroflexota bacterium]